jgi:hypothetical protein
MLQASTPKPWSLTLPRLTSIRRSNTTTWFPSTTPPRYWSATRLRMLPQPTTPRPWVLLCAQLLHRSSSFLHQPRVLHRSAQIRLCLELRNYNWRGTQQILTTQRLLLRTTLNRNTMSLWLKFTTPKPTLLLATTPKSPSTTPKRPIIAQPRMLSKFTTPRNQSVTLLQPIPNRGSGLLHHQGHWVLHYN